MSSSLQGGIQEASLQPDPLVPNVLVVPSAVLAAWQLRDGEHGYQQLTADMRPQLTDSLPAPSLVPQGRGASSWGLLGNKAQQDPTLGASILGGGPWSHRQKLFWPRGAAAVWEG